MRKTGTSDTLIFLEAVTTAIEQSSSPRQFLNCLPRLIEDHLGLQDLILYYRSENSSVFHAHPEAKETGQTAQLAEDSEFLHTFLRSEEPYCIESNHTAFSPFLQSKLAQTFGAERFNLVIPLCCKKLRPGLILAKFQDGGKRELKAISRALRFATHIFVPVIESERLQFNSDQNYHRLFRFDHLVQVGQMVAEIAHELRTPLSTVLLEVSDITPNDKTAGAYQKVKNEILRMNRFIDSLLRFSRFREISLEAIELSEFVRETLQDIPHKRIPTDMQITCDFSESITVSCDRNRLRQVLLNVLNNAFDACPDRGRLQIQTRRLSPDAVRPIQACIAIQDNGPGIPEQILAQMPKPFCTSKDNGTGLGLFNSWQIMKSLNGHLEISSSSQGTLVRILLAEEKS